MPIEGLQIWAHSFCRSTLATYRALGRALRVPFRIVLGTSSLGDRERNGFSADEFSDLQCIELEGSSDRAVEILKARQDWHQLFGSYQNHLPIQAALAAAIDLDVPFAIGSEAPCNMFAPGVKRFAKPLYLQTFSAWRVRQYIEKADFILNWSGDTAEPLAKIGWDRRKIIPFGYFPPPLPGCHFVQRTAQHHDDFHLLCTGDMTWHRGPDVLMQALIILKRWDIPFRATFTSRGPLLCDLQESARKHDIRCDFPGFVTMEELIALYETCSVFVAPGRAEPWGMRVNDALQCGAPIVVSDGMGAAKLVNDFGVGAVYGQNDPYQLAWKLRELIAAPARYRQINRALHTNRGQLSPEGAATRLVGSLMTHMTGWYADETVRQSALRQLAQPADGDLS